MYCQMAPILWEMKESAMNNRKSPSAPDRPWIQLDMVIYDTLNTTPTAPAEHGAKFSFIVYGDTRFYSFQISTTMLCVLGVSNDYLPRILPWPRIDCSAPLLKMIKLSKKF
jgi:hypothetical protein